MSCCGRSGVDNCRSLRLPAKAGSHRPAKAGHYDRNDPGPAEAGPFGEDVADERELYVNGRRVTVRTAPLHRGAAKWRSGSDRTAVSRSDVASGGPVTVNAPMPGRIVKVLVTVGETVAARQGLVVVEAMKMENELRSPRAGVVSDVRVAEGALVEAKAALVVIE